MYSDADLISGIPQINGDSSVRSYDGLEPYWMFSKEHNLSIFKFMANRWSSSNTSYEVDCPRVYQIR